MIVRLLLFIFVSFGSAVANDFEISGNTKLTDSEILNSMDSAQNDSSYIAQIEKLYRDEGCYDVEVTIADSIDFDKKSIIIYEGPLSLIEGLHVTILNDILKMEIDSIARKYLGLPAGLDQLNRFGIDILMLFANNGMPFSRGEWVDFEYSGDSKLTCRFNIVPGPVSSLSAILFDGIKRTKPSTIMKNIDLVAGDPYSETGIKYSEKSIELMKYIEVQSPFNIVSRHDGDSCEVVFHLRELPSTRIDGVGGIVNSKDGTDFLGRLDLEFGDILGTGRGFKIDWLKKDSNSNKLKIGYLEPYFPSDNLDLTLEFYQEDKDSLFLKSGAKVGIFSCFNRTFSGNVWLFVERTESENSLVSLSSVTKGVQFGFDLTAVDFRSNPTSGYVLSSDIEYRYRSNSETLPGADLPTNISSIGIDSEYYVKNGKKLVGMIGLGGWGILSKNNNIPPDELRYIGGFESLRGYAEELLPAFRYIVATVEQRVITGRYSRAYIFGDFGFLTNSPANNNFVFYPGFGMGFQVPSAFGAFRFETAWGKTGFPEDIILNIGFTGNF